MKVDASDGTCKILRRETNFQGEDRDYGALGRGRGTACSSGCLACHCLCKNWALRAPQNNSSVSKVCGKKQYFHISDSQGSYMGVWKDLIS